MFIKEFLDVNLWEIIWEMWNNLYIEWGWFVKIYWFFICVLELFFGNLDDFKKYL